MSTTSITLPRPAERAAIFSLLLVFLCGAVAGAIVMSVSRSTRHGSSPVSASLTSMSVTEMKGELNLNDEQTRQLTSILDDFSHYYDNLLADGSSRILQILNPDQRKRYAQMLEEHRK
jgi:uncharacterized membrane protein